MPTCKIKKITIPDYGDFFIRRASALLQSRVSALIANTEIPDTDKDLQASMEVLAGVLVDEQGTRLYANGRADELKEWDAQLVAAIMDEAAAFNKLTQDDATKNSVPSPGELPPSV